MPTVLAIPLGTSADGRLAQRRAGELADLLGLDADVRAHLADAVAEVAEVAGREDAAGTTPARLVLEVVRPEGAEPSALGLSVIGAGAAVRVGVPLGDGVVVPSSADLARAVLDRREHERLELDRRLEDATAGLLALLAEADRAAAEAEERDAARMRSLRALSHDLRTPLYAARGLLEELAASPGLGEADLADVDLLEGTVTEALGLLDDRLDRARDEAAAGVRPEPVAIDALLQQVRAAVCAVARGRDDDVELRVTGGDTGLVLRTDAGGLARLLRAMIGAARAAAAPTTTSIVLDVEVTRADDGAAVVLAVTGPGAAPEDLSAARGLAERLGGTLEAATAPGRGTTYTATIPSVAADDAGEA